MSPVPVRLLPPGTMELMVHVIPPSVEMKMGAFGPPVGSGVKAEAAMCSGFVGLTSRFGSLSLLVSKLICLGMMLTIRIFRLGVRTSPAGAFLETFLLAAFFAGFLVFAVEGFAFFCVFLAGMTMI